jgi:hypothetical protein
MKAISEWLAHSHLVINWTKTHAIHFPFVNTANELYKKLKLSCGSINIPFVTSTKMLGVTIDNMLKFAIHTQNICNKINGKTYLLAKSLFLFPVKFRPTLFKLFVQPHFDYCSTVIIHLSNQGDRDRLNKCFAKSIKRLLNINIFSMTLDEQHKCLVKFNILPLCFRYFFNFCAFLFKLRKRNNSKLMRKLKLNTNRTRSIYVLPMFYTDHNRFSFTTISTRLLNGFVEKKSHLSLASFKTDLRKNIVKLYNDSVGFWS